MSATISAVWAAMAVNMNLYSRGFESCKVGLGRQAGSIEFFERFRDAFCLRTRKAALLQLFDHAVGVYHIDCQSTMRRCVRKETAVGSKPFA